MPSPSPSAKRSSTRSRPGLAAVPVAATVAAAALGGVGLALDSAPMAAAGLVAVTAFAVSLAVHLIVSERRHESAEDELHAQATFLESLVESIARISSSRGPEEILDATCREARRLFDARAARVVPAESAALADAHEFEDGIRVPLHAGGDPVGTLELRRPEPFHRADLIHATVLADSASHAIASARMVADAHGREEERERLTDRLITAEQDERRRLSIFLHDGPLQTLSGIALMHDAALAAIRDGRHEDAAKVIASALERERETIRTLRDLSFAIEPLVLRDRGFVAAVDGLAEQVEASHGITVSTDVKTGERLAEKAQVALYQLIREAMNQAVQRRPERISVTVSENGDGAFTTEIEDDGVLERRRGGIDELNERVRVLNGRVEVETHPEGGTRVSVVLPQYAGGTSG